MTTLISAVVFDLDGTLTDRHLSIKKFCNERLNEFDHSNPLLWEEALNLFDDNGFRDRNEFCKLSLEKMGLDKSKTNEMEIFWQNNFGNCTTLREGVSELLKNLKKDVPLGMITNGAPKIQKSKLVSTGIYELFSDIQYGHISPLKKPHTEIFNQCSKNLQTKPSECLYIGDHPLIDIVGARGAGWEAIWASGFHEWPENIDPSKSFENISQLCHLLSEYNFK